MWYPLANFTAPNGKKLTPKIDTHGYEFLHVLEDIQSLNQRSERGELEITALQHPSIPLRRRQVRDDRPAARPWATRTAR